MMMVPGRDRGRREGHDVEEHQGAPPGATHGGAEVTFAMVDIRALQQVGAVPKAVSLHGLRLARTDDGWSSSVTLDV